MLSVMIVSPQSQSFSTLYNDKGSSADCDVQFWHPDTAGNFRPAGDVCEGSPSNWIYGSNPPQGQVLLISGSSTEVATPSSFTQIWTDKGTGATLNAAIWEMVCPAGFSALGHVCTFSSDGDPPTPTPSQYYCVANSLLGQGKAGAQIWNTEGSGADTIASFYRVSSAAGFVDVNTFWLITGSLGPPSSIAAGVILPTSVLFVPDPRAA